MRIWVVVMVKGHRLPLQLALDSDELADSTRVDFVVRHLVEANNKLLRMCGHCGEHNFSNKLNCFSCGFPGPNASGEAATVSTGPPERTPAAVGVGPGRPDIDMSRRIMKPGDWLCVRLPRISLQPDSQARLG